MKIINKYISGFAIVSTVLSTSVFTSCKDEPYKYESTNGVPTIKYVRCLSSEIKTPQDAADMQYTNGILVTSADPGSTLAIIGENMRSVKEIWFNDGQAPLNPSTLTDNVLLTSIPRKVPKAVTDKIYFITVGNDTIAYDFKVIIPAPTLTSMKNEYASAGTIQRIDGNYFIDDPKTPLTISFTKADGSLVDAKIKEISDTYDYVDVTIPEEAAEGPIVATSVYGTTKSGFYYKDSRGMLFDFDGGGQEFTVSAGKIGHGWHSIPCVSDETSLSGNYIRFGDGTQKIGDDIWDDGYFSFEYWAGAWQDPEGFTDPLGKKLTDYVNFSEWETLTLKFEINVPATSPWTTGAMQIFFAGTDLITNGNAGAKDMAGNVLAGCNNTFFNNNILPRALYKPYEAEGSFDTNGEWVTVSLPLKTSFVYGADGSAATGSLNKNSFTSFQIFCWNASRKEEKDPCTPIIKIDNIRVVPNK